jgi:hypothetical protein
MPLFKGFGQPENVTDFPFGDGYVKKYCHLPAVNWSSGSKFTGRLRIEE